MLVLSQLSLTSYIKVIFPIEVANFPISYLGSLLFPSVAFFCLLSFGEELFNIHKDHNILRKYLFILLKMICILNVLILVISKSYLIVI